MKKEKMPKYLGTNILILAAARVQDLKNEFPLYLSEVRGKLLLAHIADKVAAIPYAKFVYCFLKSEADRYHLKKVASLLSVDAETVFVPEQTQGSACTALLGACHLNPAANLLIVSANELVDVDYIEMIKDFQNRELDAATITFPSLHPRYSYVKTNSQGLVMHATQREPISNSATTGLFWFARTGDFVEAAKNLIRKGHSTDGQFFIAPVFNEIILRNMKVGVTHILPEKYIPLKTYSQIRNHENGKA